MAFFCGLLHMDIPALADEQRHTYQLCTDAGFFQVDSPRVMDDRDV